MTTKHIETPADFAEANGWDCDCIERTAELGVSETDIGRLAETDVTPDELLAWCRMRAGALVTSADEETTYAIVDAEGRITEIGECAELEPRTGHTRELVEIVIGHVVGDVIEYGPDGVELPRDVFRCQSWQHASTPEHRRAALCPDAP